MNTYEMLEEAAHRAYTRGIQTGNGGNLSARADFGMIVKSSGGSFADCLADGTGALGLPQADGPRQAHKRGRSARLDV